MNFEELITYKVERVDLGDKYKLIYTHGNVDKTFITTQTKIFDKVYYDKMLERNKKNNKLRRREIKYVVDAIEQPKIKINKKLMDEYDRIQRERDLLNKNFNIRN